MQTLTLKIEDSYYQRVVDFLELLPKKAVKLETAKHHDNHPKEREIAKAIKQGIEDVKAGKTLSFEEFKASL